MHAKAEEVTEWKTWKNLTKINKKQMYFFHPPRPEAPRCQHVESGKGHGPRCQHVESRRVHIGPFWYGHGGGEGTWGWTIHWSLWFFIGFLKVLPVAWRLWFGICPRFSSRKCKTTRCIQSPKFDQNAPYRRGAGVHWDHRHEQKLKTHLFYTASFSEIVIFVRPHFAKPSF